MEILRKELTVLLFGDALGCIWSVEPDQSVIQEGDLICCQV